MTNVEKLKLIYDEKVKNGLVHVGLTFSDSAYLATREDLAAELVRLEEAIQAGKFTEIDFGDYSLVIPRTGIGPINRKYNA